MCVYVCVYLAERGCTKEGPHSQSTAGHEASAALQHWGTGVGLSAPHQPPAVLLLLRGTRRVRTQFLPLLIIFCHSVYPLLPFSLTLSVWVCLSSFHLLSVSYQNSLTLSSVVDQYAPPLCSLLLIPPCDAECISSSCAYHAVWFGSACSRAARNWFIRLSPRFLSYTAR